MGVYEDKAKKLQRLYEIAESEGDEESSILALREMKKLQDSAQEQIFNQTPETNYDPNSRRGKRVAKREETRNRIEGLRKKSEEMGVPYARDLEEIGAAPEMNELSMASFKASLGSLFTFGDEEVGDILKKQLNAEIIKDAEGSYIAKMPSGGFYAINKPGASPQDLIKTAANVAAFTPAGSTGSLAGIITKGAMTQTAIEAGQSSLGGEVNPEDIALAGAGVLAIPAVSGLARASFRTISSGKQAVNNYLQEASLRNELSNLNNILNGVEKKSIGKVPKVNQEETLLSLQQAREELLPVAGSKLSRGEIKKLNAEKRDLEYKLSKINEPTKEDIENEVAKLRASNKKINARERKTIAKDNLEWQTAESRRSIQKNIDIINEKISKNDLASKAGYDISLIDKGILPERFQKNIKETLPTQEPVKQEVSPEILSRISSIEKQLNDFQQAKIKKPEIAVNLNESEKNLKIKESIKNGTVESAGYKINKEGKVVADNIQRDLLRNGVDDRIVVLKNSASKSDRSAYLKMINKAEKFIKGERGSEIDRPQVVIGESAMKRFEVIKNAQKEASKKIGEAVNEDLSKKSVDITGAVNSFYSKIAELGVGRDGNKLNFKESLIRGSNTTPLKHVNDVIKTKYDNASELHKVKQFITNQINYDTPAKKPLDKQAENILKELRSNINNELRKISDKYAKANDDYKKAVDAIVPWTKSMGRKFNPDSDRIDNFVGQELRKTITNYQKSNEIIENIDLLNETAKYFGAKFDDDIMSQVMLNSELERIFGSFAPGSLQGVMEKAGGSLAGAAIDATVPSYAKGTIKSGVEAVKNRVMFSPPVEEKIKILNKFRELFSE